MVGSESTPGNVEYLSEKINGISIQISGSSSSKSWSSPSSNLINGRGHRYPTTSNGSSGLIKPLSKEHSGNKVNDKEVTGLLAVKRKRDFKCVEMVNGRLVNVLEGLELHTGVFNVTEQQRFGLNCNLVSIHPNSMKIEKVEKPCDPANIPPSEALYVHHSEPTTYKRNECKYMPVQLFAILSMQRSESGWFETLLNNHTNVSSNGEILFKERRSNVSTITTTLDKVYNLDWLSSALENECTNVVGFKWMLN